MTEARCEITHKTCIAAPLNPPRVRPFLILRFHLTDLSPGSKSPAGCDDLSIAMAELTIDAQTQGGQLSISKQTRHTTSDAARSNEQQHGQFADAIIRNLSTGTTTALSASLTLLGVPLEIRREIYKHFLQSDPNGDYLADSKCSQLDFKILWISSQLRNEAFEYLCAANRWMQIGLYTRKNGKQPEKDKLPEISSQIPHAVLPRAVVDKIVEVRIMTIRAGYGCGRKKLPEDAELAHRLIVPYTTAVHSSLCTISFRCNAVEPNFAFDLGPKYLRGNGFMQLMASTILPFASMRYLDTVRFTSLMSKPLLQQISTIMTKGRPRPEHYHEFLLGLRELGDFHAEHSNLMTASVWYKRASEFGPAFNYHIVSGTPGWELSRPERSAIFAVGVDIGINAAAALLRQIELGMLDGILHDDCLGQIRDCDEMLKKSWGFGGASNEQRMLLHYYTGRMWYYISLYIAQKGSSKVVHQAVQEMMQLEKGISRAKIRAVMAQDAATHFFFAGELVRSHQMSIKARSHYEELLPIIRAELDAAELTKMTKIVEINIEGHGIWRGSSEVAEKWYLDPKAGTSIYTKAGLRVKSEEELEKMRVELGIPEVKPLGLLRFIVD